MDDILDKDPEELDPLDPEDLASDEMDEEDVVGGIEVPKKKLLGEDDVESADDLLEEELDLDEDERYDDVDEI